MGGSPCLPDMAEAAGGVSPDGRSPCLAPRRNRPYAPAMARIAFIGLGVMGAPMAAHLAAAGHALVVHNRDPGKAHDWVEKHGGAAAATPADAAAGVDAVISCVGTDADLDSVALGPDGAFGAMREGALFVDHTTVSAKIARRIGQEARRRGLHSVDAPVSGGEAGARKGQLAIMCGGTPEAIAAAEPLMRAYALRIVHVGPDGSGQLTKMVNQIAIAGIVQGLSEALHFAKSAGLDTAKVFDAISGGAAQSWQMVNRWQTMDKAEFDFGFAVDWMRKDLGLTLDEARGNGARLPLAALVDQFYADVQAMGGGRQDTSSLIRRLTR